MLGAEFAGVSSAFGAGNDQHEAVTFLLFTDSTQVAGVGGVKADIK